MSDIVVVVSADDMSDDDFCRHMDARHAKDTGADMNGSLVRHPDRAPQWIGPYRTFHDRLHDIALPDELDHEHLF